MKEGEITKRSVLLFFSAILVLSFPLKSAFSQTTAPLPEKPASREDRSAENPADLDGESVPAGREEFDEDFDLEEDEGAVYIPDPFEPLNRGFFWFNDRFYFFVLKPVARLFRVVPEPARVSISNFFSNIATPIRFVNSLLQLKLKDAGNELARFVINTTVGLGGLFDPARNWADVRIKEEDFGQTLGWYGIGTGTYMVFPILGPTNTRDGIGDVVDLLFDPIAYVDNIYLYLSLKSLAGVNATSLDKDTYESIKRRSLDPYVFIRNAYTQRRKGLVER
ncbi:MAG: VacJ family lipoprotein [Deltaproteobacteria bacterium]|nr:VacJ family lipoprotein [Deltaproteobacteria bacterium]NIS78045.1 VacJ family lipoprotein [Deltaproteobacteria bacterium]